MGATLAFHHGTIGEAQRLATTIAHLEATRITLYKDSRGRHL